MTLSAIFYPCHFVRTILSIPFCPIPFCPYTILSIPFCPYYFVRYHFVLEPYIGLHRICPVTAIGPVELFKLQSPIFPSFSKCLHLCQLTHRPTVDNSSNSIAHAERVHNKFKLIEDLDKFIMSQECYFNFAIMSVISYIARTIDFDTVVRNFLKRAGADPFKSRLHKLIEPSSK